MSTAPCAELLALLRCPRCLGELLHERDRDGLRCPRCTLLYPIIDGIPNLLLEDARPCPASP